MKIIWTDTALRTYEENIAYLFENWSYREVEHFINATEEAIENIKIYPYIGTVSQENMNFRKFLVVPQIYLFYKIINNNEIFLAVFFNNFQNPKNLSNILIS